MLPIKPSISKERLKLLAINAMATVIIALSLQMAIPIHRPCQIEPNAYSICIPFNAFPSIHASILFSFVFPFLGQLLFLPLYAIALLISWFRVNEGLHSWLDIGGGFAIAGLGYNFAETLINKRKKIIFREDERGRQLVHASIGLILCSMIRLTGIETTTYFVLTGTCIGLLIIDLVLMGYRVPCIDKLLGRLERKGVMPGEGSMYYVLGVLFALGLLRNNSAEAISVIIILALGDSLATYIGRHYGKHKLPWNGDKTIEGSLGFAAGAICSLLVLPTPITILAVISSTAIESLPIRLDDNIILPIASSLIYYFML
jgi:dolichol kinase